MAGNNRNKANAVQIMYDNKWYPLIFTNRFTVPLDRFRALVCKSLIHAYSQAKAIKPPVETPTTTANMLGVFEHVYLFSGQKSTRIIKVWLRELCIAFEY